MNLNLNVAQCQRLFGTNIVDISAKMELSRLSVRQRNMLLRYLENAYIATSRGHNVGFIADHMLKATGMFYMWGKLRGYMYVQYPEGMQLPDGVFEQIQQLRAADEVAAKVSGKWYEGAHNRGWQSERWFRLISVSPAKHLPRYLASYSSSAAYRAAVEPWIDYVRTGGTIYINVETTKLTR